ncbi:MAG TPA: zinc dependent phospholipase C family protein [Bryobacteraceae bacterium]|nr:zinc dependent phospholipase C family protein [Bryobacteraceae bacterium]
MLSHEAIIDSAWDQNIKPLLMKKYPQATPAELQEAHAHAYAGCIIQDMGYYPFGNKFFSDLVHYLRSGDFVVNMIREAQSLDEYAFALGALAHYAADTQGHGVAVNRSVPIQYPKLERKFGRVVTYEDDPAAHLKVEFSFDVLQVSRGNYAPQSYHDFIGFAVSKNVLERGFYDTYSLELTDLFKDLDKALATYRHIVSGTIPHMTRVAWRLKKDELVKTRPGVTRRAFIYNLSKAGYRKEWDGNYRTPGPGSAVLAFLIRILPKFGPLRALAFKAPNSQTERLFEDSFDRTLAEYRRLLGQVDADKLALGNIDLDTGKPTEPTAYRLADKSYAELALKLAAKPPDKVDPQVRDNILNYYRDLDLPFATKKKRKDWQKTLAAIEKLKGQAAVAENRP